MAGITGMADTFDTPNFVGELFAITPNDTPFLSAIGGLTGGKSTTSTLFQWQKYDLRSSTTNNVALEGAAAPTAVARTRANVVNVVEIHHSAVEVSYTKLAAIGQYNSTGSSHAGSVGIAGSNPVQNEATWQIAQELKAMGIDIEKSFLSGTFQNPANNSTARKTQGLIGACTTNTVDLNGASITEESVLDLMEEVWQAGGIQESGMITLIANSHNKRKLSKLFITDKDAEPESRNVGGVNLQSIETDFGVVNIMMDRHMPQDTVLVCSLEECVPVFLEIPGKGFLFVEELAKTGASDASQIYGEIGLEYGLEQHHGTLTECDTTADS
jgi:hypothetical protein